MIGEILGELAAYVLITYAIYWVLKKITTNQINATMWSTSQTKKELTKTQKTALAIISITIMLALILLSATRRQIYFVHQFPVAVIHHKLAILSIKANATKGTKTINNLLCSLRYNPIRQHNGIDAYCRKRSAHNGINTVKPKSDKIRALLKSEILDHLNKP